MEVFARRDLKSVLSDLKDPIDFVLSVFVFIDYLDDLHMNKRLFHGDIKPENIFIEPKIGKITSDSGSLLPLYSREIF